ncbi:unnamed protein product, partial [marine sediment metagenome]
EMLLLIYGWIENIKLFLVINQQSSNQKLAYKKDLCPKAEDFYEREINIPMYFSLTKKEQNFIIKSILEFFKI